MVIISRGRSIDDDTAKDAVPGLNIEMRVPPRRSVLRCTPLVSDRVAGCRGALRKRGHTIILVRVVLPNTVEVDRRAVVLLCTCQCLGARFMEAVEILTSEFITCTITLSPQSL